MTENDTTRDGSNQPDRDALIVECTEKMNDIEERRKELNSDAADCRLRLTDAGIQVKAFEFSRKLGKMEVEARDSYLDDLQISMMAQGIAVQGNFFLPDGPADAE